MTQIITNASLLFIISSKKRRNSSVQLQTERSTNDWGAIKLARHLLCCNSFSARHTRGRSTRSEGSGLLDEHSPSPHPLQGGQSEPLEHSDLNTEPGPPSGPGSQYKRLHSDLIRDQSPAQAAIWPWMSPRGRQGLYPGYFQISWYC